MNETFDVDEDDELLNETNETTTKTQLEENNYNNKPSSNNNNCSSIPTTTTINHSNQETLNSLFNFIDAQKQKQLEQDSAKKKTQNRNSMLTMENNFDFRSATICSSSCTSLIGNDKKSLTSCASNNENEDRKSVV